jgi:ABC-type lipoprotein release transport system permease subunit
MLSYALRNAIHYRSKYAAAFGLICVIAFLLSLSLFALRGVERESAKYARAYGDVQFESNERASVPKLAGAAKKILGDSGLAEKWIGITLNSSGTIFNARAQQMIQALQMEEMGLFSKIELTEGELPGEGEVALPSGLRRKFAPGQTVTFLFKTQDQILDSRKLRVSGFYAATSQFQNSAMLVNRGQFLDLHPTREVPNLYFVYLKGYGVPGHRVLDEAEFETLKTKLEGEFKAEGIEAIFYATSIYRFRQSNQFIGLFIMVAVIFIVVLVIIAAMTIVNVLFLAVLDRVRIIATFMSFGMTKGRAIILLSCELLIFALAASGLGLALAAGLSPILPHIRIDMDNWVISMLLGDSRRISSIPNLRDALITLAVGTAFPFVTAVFAIRRLLRGELAQLLSFKK